MPRHEETATRKLLRLLAFILTIAAVVCVGIMFARGAAILAVLLRGQRVPFDVLFDKIAQGRAWGIAGICLFVVACILLWFTPDHRQETPE